jgi:NADH-quinone oxidoreductase subunit G
MPNQVTVKIDGKDVQVPAGTNMIEAARTIGIEIPHYCYHPHLSIAGNCRMCLVEIEAGGRGADIACNMGARDGLAIRTDNAKVAQMRKSVMEFLLVNHPLDCPICDQSGECRLQDYYMTYGKYESRLTDEKVNKKKRQDIGEHIVLDAERCVQCSRCVRFGDEVTKTGELRLYSRSNHTEIGMYPGERLAHAYQGCLADICPVGALTNKDFRFEKRVWYLKETATLCDGCATGCNIMACHDRGETFRYIPRRNDQVNDSWMCDYGRMMYKRVEGLSRLMRFTHRGNPVPAQQSHELLRLAMIRAKESGGDGAIAFATTGQETNEANWAFFELARRHFPEARLFVADGNDPGAFAYHDDILVSEDKNPNLKGAVLIGEHFGAAVGTGVLAAALASGEIKVLVVLGGDLLGRLGRDDFDLLVVIGAYESNTSKAAEYVLPAAAHLEQDGTFVNGNGRVQRLRRAIPTEGDSLPAYRLIHELAASWGNPTETQVASVVFKRIADAIPAFRGMTYDTLGDAGQDLVDLAAPAPAATAQPSL